MPITFYGTDDMVYGTFWSANMSEYAPHKFINYISLGNKFHFTNNLQLELDYWNRAASRTRFHW